MKTCSSCGAMLKDDAEFCTECGAPVAKISYPAEAPVQQGASPCDILTKTASGKLMMSAAILMTVAVLISILSGILLPAAISSSANEILNELNETTAGIGEMLGEYGIDVDTSDSIEDLYDTVDTFSGSLTGMTITVNIVPILFVIAFWLIYGSAKNGQTGTSGFTIIQVLETIAVVLVILCTVILAILMIVLNSSVSDMLGSAMRIFYMVEGFVLAMLIGVIVVEIFTIRTVKSCKVMIRENSYNGRLSAIAAIVFIVTGGAKFATGVFEIFAAILLGPVMLIAGIGSLCSCIAPILYSTAILKLKFAVE